MVRTPVYIYSTAAKNGSFQTQRSFSGGGMFSNRHQYRLDSSAKAECKAITDSTSQKVCVGDLRRNDTHFDEVLLQFPSDQEAALLPVPISLAAMRKPEHQSLFKGRPDCRVAQIWAFLAFFLIQSRSLLFRTLQVCSMSVDVQK